MRWLRARGKRGFREAVEEAERILAGRLLDCPDRVSRGVEALDLVGALGHASFDELRRFTTWGDKPDQARWQGALAYLAQETLSVAVDEASLLRIQRGTLIPLELSLLGREIPLPATPTGMVSVVRRALGTPQLPES